MVLKIFKMFAVLFSQVKDHAELFDFLFSSLEQDQDVSRWPHGLRVLAQHCTDPLYPIWCIYTARHIEIADLILVLQSLICFLRLPPLPWSGPNILVANGMAKYF